jgi:hypothetical protein
MKLSTAFAAAVAALVIAGPAFAQWPPPPPPFVVNPSLNPPPGVPLRPVTPGVATPTPIPAAPAAKPATPAADAAAHKAERKETHQAKDPASEERANACHRQADAKDLRGKARRRFVHKCRREG